MNNGKQAVYFLMGLPGSGKSFWSRELVAKSEGKIKRVNKDDIRLLLDAGKWSKEREKYVLKVQNDLIKQSLVEGYSVVCDNTNFAPKHLLEIKKIISEVEASENVKIELVEKFFDTPILECIERDAKRGAASVGSEVIYKMWNTYLRKTNPSNPNAPKAFVFDIDGTLSKMVNRGPYELHRVGEDIVNHPVYAIYQAMRAAGYKIIVFSGREGICERETKEWLTENGIIYDHFEMRAIKDCRADTIVKSEMLDRIKDQYNIVAAIDDRNSVCGMWRERGLTCFQCDFGMF